MKISNRAVFYQDSEKPVFYQDPARTAFHHDPVETVFYQDRSNKSLTEQNVIYIMPPSSHLNCNVLWCGDFCVETVYLFAC